MIIGKTRQGDVVLNIPNYNIDKQTVNVGIRMSGGADSAILAYMLALFVRDCSPHLKIHPITCENSSKPYQIVFAKRVILKIEELTGVVFQEHQTSIVSNDMYISGQANIMNKLYSENVIDCHIMGETMNPPIGSWTDEADYPMPSNRNVSEPVSDPYGKRFRPLRQINKRSVYDLYVYFDVLETLFPITRSCEKFTLDFSKHCDQCSFCRERFWGFGRYI